MVSPAAAALTADCIDPYGAVWVPEPVPVGDTKMSLAVTRLRMARKATGRALISAIVRSSGLILPIA